MNSLAEALPVVTNLQQNCGMKEKGNKLCRQQSGPSYCKKKEKKKKK